MAEETFTCGCCGETFTKGWSEDEANAEAETLWGVENASANEQMAVVCEDCFRAMTGLEPGEMLPN